MKWVITIALTVCCLSGSLAQDMSDREIVDVLLTDRDTPGFKPLTANTPMSDFRGRENRELRRTMRRIVELLEEDSDSTPYEPMGTGFEAPSRMWT